MNLLNEVGLCTLHNFYVFHVHRTNLNDKFEFNSHLHILLVPLPSLITDNQIFVESDFLVEKCRIGFCHL